MTSGTSARASFDDLYQAIVEDLVALATRRRLAARSSTPCRVRRSSPSAPSSCCASDDDVATVLEPAVSVIDLACAALGRDPMAAGLRVVDALARSTTFAGPVRC